jgi:hypothetical protein
MEAAKTFWNRWPIVSGEILEQAALQSVWWICTEIVMRKRTVIIHERNI